jgi:putative transposase
MNRIPFGIGEWYHCFNRGVDKRIIFSEESDYRRFLLLLFIANDPSIPVNIRDNYKGSTFGEIVKQEREETLVDIGAYCLMPNHFHLLLRERTGKGVSTFMQRVGTAYTMYFNTKNERTGALFAGRFKSKHVKDDEYFKRLVNYIHANSAELVEPGWKSGNIRNRKRATEHLLSYPYSSLADYLLDEERSEASIINRKELLDFYDDSFPTIPQLFDEAVIFAQEEKL